MSADKKIEGSAEAWEKGSLGENAKYAKAPSKDFAIEVDDAMGLQSISIRLQKSLIEDFRAIAALNNIGYQTLMRQILQRFADAEKKKILQEAASAAVKARSECDDQNPEPDPEGKSGRKSSRKVA